MNGSRLLTIVAGGTLAVLLVVVSTTERLTADEQVVRDAATTQVALLQNDAGETKSTKKKRAEPRGRLPNNYAKLGISEKQRETIYGIQAKYREQMEALEKQLADLRGKRDAEVEAVLTDDQKKKLAELQAASKRGTDSKPAASGESSKSSE